MLGACNRDIEDVEPSYADKDHFAVADKPGELNQLLYKIYVDTGVPIFVSDTLNVETYTDANGEEVSKVELFDLTYDVFGSATEQISDSIKDPRFVLCGDEAAMIKAAELMRDKVIPHIPNSGEGRGKCYFLVDSLQTKRQWRNWTTYTTEYAWTDFTIYNATQGVVVGGLNKILTMTPEEQDLWCGRVIGTKVTAWLMENKTTELDSFYSVTNEGRTLTKTITISIMMWFFPIIIVICSRQPACSAGMPKPPSWMADSDGRTRRRATCWNTWQGFTCTGDARMSS